MSEKNTKTIVFKLDPANPPALDPAQLERLRNMKDEEIDLSDIPASAPGTVWKRRYPAALRKAS